MTGGMTSPAVDRRLGAGDSCRVRTAVDIDRLRADDSGDAADKDPQGLMAARALRVGLCERTRGDLAVGAAVGERAAAAGPRGPGGREGGRRLPGERRAALARGGEVAAGVGGGAVEVGEGLLPRRLRGAIPSAAVPASAMAFPWRLSEWLVLSASLWCPRRAESGRGWPSSRR
jgi:hypothetical protein